MAVEVAFAVAAAGRRIFETSCGPGAAEVDSWPARAAVVKASALTETWVEAEVEAEAYAGLVTVRRGGSLIHGAAQCHHIAQ